MDINTKRSIIAEMDDVINRYVYEHELFYGGCCYAAYVLARYLTKLGISYDTTIFQYNEIINCRKFNTAINGNGVCHVAIRVYLDDNWVTIGSLESTYRYFRLSGNPYKEKHYRGIDPATILKGYRDGLRHARWNWMYNTDNNSKLSRDIKRIYLKYADKI